MARHLLKFDSEVLLRKAGRHPVFLFDFDGTLTDLAETPDKVDFKHKTRSVVEDLSKSFPVGIISGRKLGVVKRLVKIRDIYYSGNHGVEIEGPNLKFIEPISRKSAARFMELSGLLRRQLNKYAPLVESKKYSVAVHYRAVDPLLVKPLLSDFNAIVREDLEEGRFRLLKGKKVVEIRAPIEWNKGSAIGVILNALGKGKIAFFFGDDLTDEFGFKEVNGRGGVSVIVGRPHRKTNAKYRIDSPSELVDEIERFVCLAK